MVLTVEPGLYVSDRLSVPEGQPEIDDRWKGIGIRIEDDVAVHIPDQQAQVHQTLHQNSQGGVVHRLRRAAGSHNGNRSFLSLQHQAVELPLFRREAAIHREGTGDVTVVVILQRTTGIDQQQVAVLKRCLLYTSPSPRD